MRQTLCFLAASLALAEVLLPAPRAVAAENGVGEKPYMGWDSWSFFRGKPTEAKIKAQADAMAAKLKPFGYVYINIDSGIDAAGEEIRREINTLCRRRTAYDSE